jgi:hypothetical protein
MKLGFEIPDREPMSRIRWGVDVGWAMSFNLQPWLHEALFLGTKLGVRAELIQDTIGLSSTSHSRRMRPDEAYGSV